MKIGKSRAGIIIISVICSLVVLCGVFFLGFYSREWTLSGGASYGWAVSMIDKHYVGEVKEDGTVSLPLSGYTSEQLALKALTAKLDDYSTYYTAEEYRKVKQDNAGSKTGIGFSYRAQKSGDGILVSRVLGNSPAYISGMRAGDVLIGGTAGEQSVEFTQSETQTAAQKLSAFIDARADGEEFTLNTAEHSFTVSKQSYSVSYASMYTSQTAWRFVSSANGRGLSLVEDKPEALNFLPQGTAYLTLSQFYGTAAGEVGALLEKFNASGCSSLIIDLRGNGGGFVSVMCDIAGYFVPSNAAENIAMVAAYKDGRKDTMYCYNHLGASASLVAAETNVYVLANSETASASEALIGVLVSYGVTDYNNIFVSDYSEEYIESYSVTKTARTYGKGIMQTTFERYETGEALKLTTANIYWPNGVCIHGSGLSAANGCTVIKDVGAINERNDTELKKVLSVIAERP